MENAGPDVENHDTRTLVGPRRGMATNQHLTGNFELEDLHVEREVVLKRQAIGNNLRNSKAAPRAKRQGREAK